MDCGLTLPLLFVVVCLLLLFDAIENAAAGYCSACVAGDVCVAGNGTQAGAGVVVVSEDCGAGRTVVLEVLEMRRV